MFLNSKAFNLWRICMQVTSSDIFEYCISKSSHIFVHECPFQNNFFPLIEQFDKLMCLRLWCIKCVVFDYNKILYIIIIIYNYNVYVIIIIIIVVYVTSVFTSFYYKFFITWQYVILNKDSSKTLKSHIHTQILTFLF